MKWAALESKMLSAAAYDDSKQVLYLRFRATGHVYRYFEFTLPITRPSSGQNRRAAFPSSYPRSLPLRAYGQAPRRLISPRNHSPDSHLLWWRPFRSLH